MFFASSLMFGKKDNKVTVCEKNEDGNEYFGDTDEAVMLMQFTGLLDRNGKEIYEGDITEDGRGMRYEIVWDELNVAFNFKDVDYYDGNQLAQGAEYITVIGNIYENPELLKA